MYNPTLLAQTIRTILQASGYVTLPVTQQNVLWMQQQLGASADAYPLVMQQMQLERQQYLSQAIAQVLQASGYGYLPATPQNVVWMMQQIGAIAGEEGFISYQLQVYQPAATSPQSTGSQTRRSPEPVRFGQQNRIDLAVNARCSSRETTYFFSAVGFDPHIFVQARITSDRKQTVYTFTPAQTNRDGYADSAAFKWVPPIGIPAGQYLFIASGRCRGKEMTSQIAFEVE